MGLNDRDKNLICAGLWLLLGVPNFVEVDPLNTGRPISDWTYFGGILMVGWLLFDNFTQAKELKEAEETPVSDQRASHSPPPLRLLDPKVFSLIATRMPHIKLLNPDLVLPSLRKKIVVRSPYLGGKLECGLCGGYCEVDGAGMTTSTQSKMRECSFCGAKTDDRVCSGCRNKLRKFDT